MSHSKSWNCWLRGLHLPESALRREDRQGKREEAGKELKKFWRRLGMDFFYVKKQLAGHTEDTMTIATEAAENDHSHGRDSPGEIGSVTCRVGV